MSEEKLWDKVEVVAATHGTWWYKQRGLEMREKEISE